MLIWFQMGGGEMRGLRRCELVCIALLLTLLACGPLSPPESCGDYGGTADEGLFDEYFISMGLFYATSSMPGEIGVEGEIQFNPDAELAINFESVKDVSVRACIQERKGGGKIVFDEVASFPAGEGSFFLGSCTSGGYVIRVIVDETLVKNFPFWIE